MEQGQKARPLACRAGGPGSHALPEAQVCPGCGGCEGESLDHGKDQVSRPAAGSGLRAWPAQGAERRPASPHRGQRLPGQNPAAQTPAAPGGPPMCRSAGQVSPSSTLSATLVRQVSLPQGPRVADIRILPGPWVLPPGPEPRLDRTDLGQAMAGQTRPGLQVLMSWWPAGIGLGTEGAQGGFPKGPGERVSQGTGGTMVRDTGQGLGLEAGDGACVLGPHWLRAAGVGRQVQRGRGSLGVLTSSGCGLRQDPGRGVLAQKQGRA